MVGVRYAERGSAGWDPSRFLSASGTTTLRERKRVTSRAFVQGARLFHLLPRRAQHTAAGARGAAEPEEAIFGVIR